MISEGGQECSLDMVTILENGNKKEKFRTNTATQNNLNSKFTE